MRKAIWIVCLVILCMGFVFPAPAETGLENFKVRRGDPESKKIAITMDDFNEPEWGWKAVELCKQYGIRITFFPNGRYIYEEDAEHWRDAVESGFEIGSHGYDHRSLPKLESDWTVLSILGKHQQQLDLVLGYHYQIRWYRPPYGNVAHTNTLKKFGYDHALLWTVSQTDPDKAIKEAKNGCIMLFHARKKDYECLEKLIPMLLEAGFEPVTVSELFGFDPPETSEEPYVYNKEDYR